jgi:hypothetical protein
MDIIKIIQLIQKKRNVHKSNEHFEKEKKQVSYIYIYNYIFIYIYNYSYPKKHF